MYSSYDSKQGIEVQIMILQDGCRRVFPFVLPYSDLITKENQEGWAEYLRNSIPRLVNAEALGSPEFEEVIRRKERRQQWEAERVERERKEYEARRRRSSMEKPRMNFIPKGLTVDYEQVYGQYLGQIVAFIPTDNEDYLYQLRYLERWCKKSVPLLLEQGRPDAAYAIAMQVCKSLPRFLEKKELKSYNENHKIRIRKLIKDAFVALVQAVTLWNHEENRRIVVDFMKDQIPTYRSFRGLGKTLSDSLPQTPFVGSPVETVREKSSEDIARERETERLRKARERAEREARSLIPLNTDYERKIFTVRNIDWDCNTIFALMNVEEERISELLEAGKYDQAALLYMQLIKSMCRHFVSDEHYNFFDDMYSPDYTATDITRLFNRYQSEGKLPEEVVNYLDEAWKEIKEEESFWNYGYPSEEWKS